MVTISCSDGYDVIGDQMFDCLNGDWSTSTVPSCSRPGQYTKP